MPGKKSSLFDYLVSNLLAYFSTTPEERITMSLLRQVPLYKGEARILTQRQLPRVHLSFRVEGISNSLPVHRPRVMSSMLYLHSYPH